VAAALLSSANDVPVEADMVVFGEIGLSGEVRAVSQMDGRLKEATKLGFAQALMPVVRRQAPASGKSAGRVAKEGAIGIRRVGHVQDLVSLFRPGGKA
jgi:DNA repair protein RadA/Sms